MDGPTRMIKTELQRLSSDNGKSILPSVFVRHQQQQYPVELVWRHDDQWQVTIRGEDPDQVISKLNEMRKKLTRLSAWGKK